MGKLPEELVGKTLFPSITYKNVTLQVNFGPQPKVPLPFKCRMLQDAAEEDLEICKASAGVKPEVLFPLGLPDQGVFDWLDMYLDKNPKFLELSDRKVLEWARRSGVFRPKGYFIKDSNDRPGMHFNLPVMDDNSVQQALSAVAPAVPRDYVVMELKANLMAATRAEKLRQFPAAYYRRVAVVVMGEPPAEYKAKIQDVMLKEKLRRAEADKKRKEQMKQQQRADDKGGKGRRSQRSRGGGDDMDVEDKEAKEAKEAEEGKEAGED